MKPIKILLLAALVLGLAACSTPHTADPSVSRSEPLDTPLLAVGPQMTFNVAKVRVAVPNSLVVSEANVYYPTADIVWHGEGYGQRHQQVKAIFEAAMAHGVQNLHGNRAVIVDVEVKRFHSLTQRARYTVGGVHSIKFVMTLRDEKTGALIGKPQMINADLKAFGGKKAVANERLGLTQKVRIMSHLASLIEKEVIQQQDGAVVQALPVVAAE